MILPRLATRLWVNALVRRCNGLGYYATVIRHGYDEAGAVLLTARNRSGHSQLFGATILSSGERAWLTLTGATPVDEHTLTEVIDRHRRTDPDLWVVELETEDLSAILEDPILSL